MNQWVLRVVVMVLLNKFVLVFLTLIKIFAYLGYKSPLSYYFSSQMNEKIIFNHNCLFVEYEEHYYLRTSVPIKVIYHIVRKKNQYHVAKISMKDKGSSMLTFIQFCYWFFLTTWVTMIKTSSLIGAQCMKQSNQRYLLLT